MSSQLWIHMLGYRNYITYVGRKLKNKICMAGYRKYIFQIRIDLLFCLNDKACGTKTEHSDVAMYGGRIHVYIFIPVRFDQSTVATYGGILKLFIIHIRFYLFFCFSDEVRGTKTEHYNEAMYGRRIHVYILFCTQLFG